MLEPGAVGATAAKSSIMDLVELEVSAPGKLILFGEHAVVYGKTALAASLDLRSLAILKELPASKFCEIEMPGVGLSNCSIPVEQLQESLFAAATNETTDEGQMHSWLLDRARKLVDKLGGDCCRITLDERQRCSLECVFYALARIAHFEGVSGLSTGFQLRLDTTLPLGAGLGSSASFSVCLAAAFLLWARLRHGRWKQSSPSVAANGISFDHQSLREVSRHALGCEKIMHGQPSGVDNEVCTFGSMIEFRKGEEPILVSLSTASKGWRVLLVNTHVGRSTKSLVDKLARLHAQYPQVFDSIFCSIDHVSRRVVEIVSSSSHVDAETCFNHLSTLIDVNQGLLTACQVSHPTIDSICATAKKYGLSAKLTGAGGGGFVYILVPPATAAASSAELQNLIRELTACDFSVIETNLGNSGLLVHNASIQTTTTTTTTP